ncbi:MAG: HAMP domain-containing histidine kinase [Proteobacteria bacterium]|nr:HAMP domain-containing histidine kinase [Pseudomonadota bacterium]
MSPPEATETERLRALALALVHALRSPLAAMRAAAEEGRDQPAAAATGAAFALIDEQIERMDTMLGDFALLARARAARRRPVHLRGLLDRACPAIAPRVTTAALPVAIEAPDDQEVTVDPAQIERALTELLTNALEAPGVSRVALSAVYEADELRLAVSDDGAGIPASIKARDGELFVSTKPWGTGLGWAVCRMSARAHGGELTIDSAGGRTTASVVLPSRSEG